MMFKTVDFNIFRENLQHIVYGEQRPAQAEKDNPSENRREKTTQKLTETIVIKPITETGTERERR
jgi:hypothetical protein